LVSQGLIQSGIDAIVIEPSPAGLEPERGTFFLSVLVPAIFLLRTIPSLMGLKAVDQVAKGGADHAAQKGAAGQVSERIFDRELKKLSAGKTAHFRSSCIVIGRKDG
jgi:hypothetical protein